MLSRTRKQSKTAPISTRKPTRLQNLYRKVTKSKTNMAISAAIFATVMAIVGLFVTSKGAPLSGWTTLRNVLTKTPPGRILANLFQKLIDLVCSLLGIGIYPGCIVEFKDEDKTIFEKGSLGNSGSASEDLPEKPVNGKAINGLCDGTEYVVVEVDGDNLKLKCKDDKITMKNLKKKSSDEDKKLMLTRGLCTDSNKCKKPYDYAPIPRELMKKTGKIDKE
jgi:hypothetical protein